MGPLIMTWGARARVGLYFAKVLFAAGVQAPKPWMSIQYSNVLPWDHPEVFVAFGCPRMLSTFMKHSKT